VLYPFGAGLHSSPRSGPLVFAARRFRLMAAILLVVWPLSACYFWEPLPAPEKGFGRNVDSVRVRTPDEEELVVWHPILKGDSLFGASSPAHRDSIDTRLGNLRDLRMRHRNVVGSVVYIGIGAGLLVGLITVMASQVKSINGGHAF
jgi:hypothetical protein